MRLVLEEPAVKVERRDKTGLVLVDPVERTKSSFAVSEEMCRFIRTIRGNVI